MWRGDPMQTQSQTSRWVAACCVMVMCGCQRDLTGAAGQDRFAKEATMVTPSMDWSIEVTGAGLNKPTVFNYEQLAHMEMKRVDNVLQQMTHFPDRMTSWRGPSLDSLLAACELKPGPMKITVEASDGYRKDCTLDDLDAAIVALQDGEGRWLEGDRTRRIRLVPPRKTGDYWVADLRRVVVEPLRYPEGPR